MKLRIEGMKELERDLRKLKDFTARRVGRRAMTAALEPVAAAAKAAAPRSGDGRHMADSIAVGKRLVPAQAREAPREGKHLMLMYVGPKEPHAHLVEFGTVERFHRSGKSVGRMPAQPFMRPAWDGNREAVLATLTAELRVELDKALARAARRAARAAR